ncbi:GNVR domain-containing protein [Mesorhizobium muleiense]|uniref:GNVR domain-containing protein n=1 Tax=Mesorhizobium muleiense TaxID=1004279 RepID=UPI001F37609F|nr:GNVR domain-containing protein [Mesorhizobium muleiense]MCF6114488.1 Wzz/FepE/Etk N-terminal domain-containing protein [Mesorhizobium muleiense]
MPLDRCSSPLFLLQIWIEAMLDRPSAAIAQKPWLGTDAPQDFISLADVVSFARQYLFSILAFVVAGIVCATFYFATSDPIYSARTQILIEPKIPKNLQQQPAEVNLSLDTAQVESQLAVLRSQKIAMMVIDDLGLMDNPTFRDLDGPTIGERFRRAWMSIVDAGGLHAGNAALTDFFHRVLPWPDRMEANSPQLESERRRQAVEMFSDGLDVQRVGVSYAIDITFQSQDPALAARIANATAEAFVREQVQTTKATASESIAWLERRMREVGDQMNRATRVAQEFRAKHDYSIGQDETSVAGEDLAHSEGQPTHQITLEQLEVTADTYRKMYESLLAAYTNSVDQQPYLIADARVITSATSPKKASRPRKTLILAFGALAGMVAGIGFAVARRGLDRNVRTPRQIRRELGLACIGELPPVSFRRGGFGRLDEVLRNPDSSFSGSLRSVKAIMGLAGANSSRRRIGITSVSPGDGKSTVVSNLAALCGATGTATLVINADDKSALANERLFSADFNVIDRDSGSPKDIGKQIRFIEKTSFYYLKNDALNSANLLVPDNMEQLLSEVGSYSIVIVELPPFSSGAEGLALCPLLDGVIVVAQWGVTSLDQLEDLTQTLKNTNSSVLGVLMTRVRTVSARRYRKRAGQAPR